MSNILPKANLQKLLAGLYLPLFEKLPLFGAKKKVIVLAGPTAVGKTELSLELAKLLGGEIISADSMQVYRKMDIGTAKVAQEVRQNIPHHLIDVVDIQEPFNVMHYFAMAEQAMREITSRGNVPIVVGGAGFYLQSLLYGPPLGPKSDPVVRGKLEKKMEEIGCSSMYEQVQLLDPEYAKSITENDRHKIIRALEIMTLSEKKVTAFKRSFVVKNDLYDFRLWFLQYPLETLYHRIEERCAEMLEKGFLKEVRSLKQEGLAENPLAAKAIGYRQALAFLETAQTSEDFAFFVYQFKKASCQYARKQCTWFRKDPHFRPLSLESYAKKHTLECILQDYEQGALGG
ncbi:MAG: tRNA (adenosine(37)-N6)-dimethylallyltransferase MiaA [Chlamydiota bacterium]